MLNKWEIIFLDSRLDINNITQVIDYIHTLECRSNILIDAEHLRYDIIKKYGLDTRFDSLNMIIDSEDKIYTYKFCIVSRDFLHINIKDYLDNYMRILNRNLKIDSLI